MLSILIPVYNFDVRSLVYGLHQQCIACNKPFEILCFDDASTDDCKQANRQIVEHGNVKYKELPENMGRAAIRNFLAQNAHYEFLLFMDCDSKLPDERFMERYLELINPQAVICGGRIYSPVSPEDQTLLLHWKYGINREQKSARERSKAPWHSFMTNNFLIPKNVLLEIGFDETLTQYGHEDTLFGLELAKRKIPIKHIDNSLEHIGLEASDEFLIKTRRALQNLNVLFDKGTPIETRLLSQYMTLKNWGLADFLRFVFRLFRSRMEAHLKSSTPTLFIFDLYKLGYFASISKV